MKIKWKTIAPLIVWFVIYLLPIPAGLNANQWHYFAVFAAVITGLVLESMPVGAVGLIGLTFAAVMVASNRGYRLGRGRIRRDGPPDPEPRRVKSRYEEDRQQGRNREPAHARPISRARCRAGAARR